ncbi:hypothetical protein EF910_06660 [Streptomyces sp. WAC07149]|uniref:hypothetical protein n=1 Tax=Streptomyces sp. WAC07149 TaxID=2487425 RepID=UPI000F79C530|nr:hypothetical protein [Streptomyces sp. WAC07149]RST07358.1 hypothetical protein EF910_06660 [Streptomyces sp. WAC07149]
MSTPPSADSEPLRVDRVLRAKAILNSYAPAPWAICPDERDARFGYFQVARLIWRFDEPHDELIPVFEAAARDAPRCVGWEFTAGENWCIQPTRLAEEWRGNGKNMQKAKLAVIQDQEFCLAASQDLDLILQMLAASAPNPGRPEGTTS